MLRCLFPGGRRVKSGNTPHTLHPPTIWKELCWRCLSQGIIPKPGTTLYQINLHQKPRCGCSMPDNKSMFTFVMTTTQTNSARCLMRRRGFGTPAMITLKIKPCPHMLLPTTWSLTFHLNCLINLLQLHAHHSLRLFLFPKADTKQYTAMLYSQMLVPALFILCFVCVCKSIIKII